MKNSNLIKRLWTDSHEKQSPQRFARYTAMLIMLLTLGVGNVWGANATFTTGQAIFCYTGNAGNFRNDGAIPAFNIRNTSDSWSTPCGTQIGNSNYYYYCVPANINLVQIRRSNPSGCENWNGWSDQKDVSSRSSNSQNMVSISEYGTTWTLNWGTYEVKLKGSIDNWTNDLGTLVDQNNGTFKYTISNFEATATSYDFKVYDSGNNWYGNNGNNVSITDLVAGATYDIVATFTLSNATLSISKTQKTFAIATSATNGSVSPTSAFVGSSGVAFTATPSTGYHWSSWGTTSGLSATNANPTSLTATVAGTLTANFEPNTYTITLDDNGSYQSNGSATATYNSGTLTGFSHASRTDWIPSGYYTDPSTGSMVIDAAGSLVANVSGYTDASGNWIRTANTTLYARWKQTYSVTYYPNFPEGTTTSGAAPTDANEYNSGASVTVLGVNTMAATGYSFAGWNTNAEGTGTSRAAGSTFSISGNTPFYAQWTENKRNVTISVSPSGAGTLNKTSASVGVATTTTVTATAQPGYRFTGWTATNCSVASTSSASTTLSGNGTTGAATLVANFAPTYAYLEGRMTVYNAARSTETHVGSSEGKWSESSFNIAMDYDATNHRFYRHTYKTPAELSATQTDETAQSQWFSIARSNASGSWSGKTTYHPSSNTDLTTAGIGQKKAAQTSSATANYRFNSSATDGYAILYFDEAGVWYELEHTLNYNANSGTGSAPAEAYYNHGANATAAAANTFSRTGYTFNGWKTGASSGTSYAAGANVPMNSNITLYAQWQINNHAVTYTAPSHGSYTITVGTADAVSENTNSDYNKTVTLAATPATGYHFVSWSVYKTGEPATVVTVTNNKFIMPDYPVTVSATFSPITYSITYYTNGGSEIAAGSYNIETATFDLPTTSTKTGYTFAGWYTNSGLTGVPVVSIEVGSYDNKEYWAKWDANEYTITLDNQYSDGEGSPGTHMGDADATHYLITYGTDWFDHNMKDAPSHGHYTFMGYWSAAGGAGTQILSDRGELLASTPYTDAEGKWTHPNNVIIYAKWSENQELNKNAGVTAGATHGAITLTYNSSAVSGYTASTRKGYLLDGYFTAASDGDEVITNAGVLADGPVTNYIDEDGKWIYENASAPNIYAQWTPVTYTVQFAKNTDPSYLGVETGTDPDEIAATYDSYPDMPANPYTRPGYQFLGWAKAEYKAKGSYNAEYPLSDYQYATGTGTHNISATQDSVAVLYPKWVGNVYTVSFNPRGASVYPTSMNVRYGETYGSGNSGSLPEPSSVPTGKTFVGWFTSAVGGTQVTAETQLRTIGAHTLYAHYEDLTQVYFKNTLGWDEVYVTYAAYWDGTNGTGNNGKVYHRMSRIIGTDVYYDQVPASVVASWTGENAKIAFNDRELLTGDVQVPTTSGNYGNYDEGEVVYRMDFDSRATMFVPRNVNTNDEDGNYKKNKAQYISTGYKEGTSSDPEYTSGYWMIFNNTYSGYLFSYQKNGAGDFSAEYGMNGAKAGDSVFVYSVKMDANTRYDLRIRKDCQTTNTKSRQFRYDTQITSSACTDLKLVCDPNNNSWMQTTAAGEYKFILTTKSDGHMYLTVEYPLAVNDYRVLYNYNDGSDKEYASEVIKPIAKDTVDTISVFVHKLETPVVSRSMKIQQCSNIDGSGNPTWSDVATGTIDLSSVSTNGVYNFAVQQYESGTPTGAFIGKYDGNFYIRTEASDGGWDQYKDRKGNVMTYSAYSMTQTLSEPYSHYYCRFIGNTSTDITFAVATKYSPNISGTKTGDDIIGDAATTLPSAANVRFSYNEATNAMTRAYIKPAQGGDYDNTRFLVMHGADDDMIFNEDGNAIPASGSLAANELQFDDMGDWVYQVMLQAVPNAEVSLIARYNEADRYLIGGASEYEKILGGEGSNKYTIMAIYDFKTNRLMNAWTPDGAISDKLSDIDMLWIRRSDNEAKQITFTGDGSLEKVKVVGAIQLRYNDLVGRVSAWSYETRPLLKYFLSFPFDVNVSDIFGLHGAELGREYVIQKYNAAERAKKGLFLGDGDTYWENLTVDSVMHANEGYCLIFDNEYLNGDLGTIWENKAGNSSVYLYFPASHELPSISDANQGTSLPSHLCEDTRTYTYGGGTISHVNSDSHWNLIGSPLFANSYVVASDGTNGQTGTAARRTLDSYYAYDGHTNVWVPTLYYSEATGKYYACKAMHAMLVQFAGSVTWSKNEPIAALAPARERKQETTNRLITLNLMQGDEEGDHTYIKMDEMGNTDFMLCEDMFKIINKNKPNIFSYAGTNCVAYNKVQVQDMTINLGVEIRKNGTYTFTMPDNVAGQVTLIDNFTQTRTNLNIEDYEINLNKGNYYDRFSIEIKVNNAPTAIDGVADGQGTLKDGKAHKFIMNDQMYILKDGVIYDARGNHIQ